VRGQPPVGVSTMRHAEHPLQVAYRPVMMARRRSGTGNWSERRIDLSRSCGAVNSSQIPGQARERCIRLDPRAHDASVRSLVAKQCTR